MATVSLDELKLIRRDYDIFRPGVRPETASGQCIYREYSFQDAAKFDAFRGKILSDDEVMGVFNTIKSDRFKEMTEQNMYDIVNVALNVKDPLTGNTIMREPWAESDRCPTFATAVPTTTSKVSMDKEDAGVDEMVVVPSSAQEKIQDEKHEDIKDQATAVCFYFAWMTRFSVKSPSTALNKQYESVRETYMKFYQRSSVVFELFHPDASWVRCFRNAFDSFIRVRNTLVLYVAASETEQKNHPRVFNLLRYLFYQNLEFMGMHAYVSIVKIMAKVSLPPALILTWLRISGAELAIDEAHKIMATLDNGMIENGETAERLWKYARLLDPGYFNRLQTAYAAELMATLAYIEIKLGLSTETGHQSPLNIFAISNNKHVRDIGKAKAEAFMECKNQVISLSHDASVVDKIYAKKTGLVASASKEESRQDPMDTEPYKRPAEEPTYPTKKRKELPPQIPKPSFTL